MQKRQATSFLRWALVLEIVLAGELLARVLPVQNGRAQTQKSSAQHDGTAALSPYIDVHTHLDETDVDGSMQSAIRAMPSENLARIIFMPSPFTLADANRF